MDESQRITKLIQKIETLIGHLDGLQEIPVHQKVNQFYYMQKVNELSILNSQLSEVVERDLLLRNRLQVIYGEVASQWKQDYLWINRYTAAKIGA